MGQTTFVVVETAQEGAHHTSLWGTGAQCADEGEVWAKSYSLGSVGEKVLYPST